METMFRFGWFLFLMAKAKLLPPPLDFVKALHLLLACINVLLVHAPPALLKTKIPDMLGMDALMCLLGRPLSHRLSCHLAFADQQVPIPSSSSEGGSAFYDPDTLLYLCMINHANYELVRDIQDRLFLVWLKTVRRSLVAHGALAAKCLLFLSFVTTALLLTSLPSSPQRRSPRASTSAD